MSETEKNCRRLQAEINFLRNTQDCIRSLIGDKEAPLPLVKDLNDPRVRELLTERNTLLFIQDGIRGLLDMVPGPSNTTEQQSSSFSPLVSFTPQKIEAAVLSESNTHLKRKSEAEDLKQDPAGVGDTSIEAGQRWPSSMFEQASCNKSSSGSTTFFELDEVEQPEQQDQQHQKQPLQHCAMSEKRKASKQNVEPNELDDSYDRVPKKEILSRRKMTKAERKQEPGYTCQKCENFYKALGFSDEEREKVMQKCTRHRGEKPPLTQKFFWYPGWVPTQEWEEYKREEENKKENSMKVETKNKRKK